MIKELVEKYVSACNELQEVTGAILFSEKLQCTTEGFFKLAKQYNSKIDVTDRGDREVPYRVSANIDGFEFFTILTQEEYEIYMKGRVA